MMKRLGVFVFAALAWLTLAGSALAAAPAGPPYPDRVAGRAVYDNAGIFGAATISGAEQTIAGIRSRTGLDIVVYTQIKPESNSIAAGDEDAQALRKQWNVGGTEGAGLVILFDMQSDKLVTMVSLQAGAAFQARVDEIDLDRIRWADMEPLLAQGMIDDALSIALTRIQSHTAPAAGPPYPDGRSGQYVYDYAGVFKPATVSTVEQTISAVRERTGAVVVIYTQIKPESDDLDKANADARALMDQWGIGRKGFDDGLVIIFDMQPNLCHGEVSLYAGAGYRAAFLSDSDRQDVFDNRMLPYLRSCDLDNALLAALRAVDANATPAHAADLERGRQINALMVVGALLLGLILIFVALGAWQRHGRDPIFIDDRSILMPAPPDGLTPAMATLILDDRTSKRTISAALIDLAAHGAIAFRQNRLGSGDAGIAFKSQGHGTIGVPESRLLGSIEKKAESSDNYIIPSHLYRLISGFDQLKTDLEKDAVRRGWLVQEPSKAVGPWEVVAGVEITLAVVAFFIWLPVQISLLFVLMLSLLLAGIFTAVISHFMPARTKEGAVLNAQLLAYKRSLGYSMTQSGSMNEVVQRHAVPWVTTPDEAMVWAVAFGLNRELDALLARAMAGAPGEETGATQPLWTPAWWTYSGPSHHLSGSGGSGPSFPSGLFSSTGFPDPGGIVAALGSIASPSSPPSSSSGGGSSFSSGGSFGGGGGGGGGGAGGGF